MDENEHSEGRPGPASGAADPPTDPPSPSANHLQDQLRGLRRSRNDKVLAGVCGGLARSFGVDPVLLRVVTAVLVLFDGTGLVLYAAAWLLLSVDDGAPSVGTRALDRSRYRSSFSIVVLAAVLAIVVTFGTLRVLNQWHGAVLIGVVVLLTLLLLQRRSTSAAEAKAGVGVKAWEATATTAPQTSYLPSVQHSTLAPPLPASLPRHPRSQLFGLTFSSVILGWGVLAAFDASGYEPQLSAYVALGLGLTGLGLLLGTWRGRARWLILWGVLLSVLLGPATVVDTARTISGPSVRKTEVITKVADLPQRAEFKSGNVKYDLSALDLTDSTARLNVRMGFGEVIVTVPPTTDVRLNLEASFGEVTTFGVDSGGIKPHVVRTDVGPDGEGGGTLNLTLYAGFGHLEVRRATS